MIEGEEPAEDFFAGGGADGVADTVVLGDVSTSWKSWPRSRSLPAVGIADGEVEFAVEAAEFEQALIPRRLLLGLLAHFGDFRGREVAGVEEVVDVGEAEPEREHQGLTVLVVTFADSCQGGFASARGLRKGERLEAIRRRVAQSRFKRAAVFACPDFVQRGLHDGVEIPAVSGENVERIGENIVVKRKS